MTSLLLRFTGKTPLFRLIDFFIENKGLDFSKAEVARKLHVSRTTLWSYWKTLERYRIIRRTRSYGKTNLYTLNGRSAIVRKFLELEQVLIREAMVNVAKS